MAINLLSFIHALLGLVARSVNAIPLVNIMFIIGTYPTLRRADTMKSEGGCDIGKLQVKMRVKKKIDHWKRGGWVYPVLRYLTRGGGDG